MVTLRRLLHWCGDAWKEHLSFIVVYVLPFFSLRNMPDLCPKGIDLGMKSSAPSYPLTLPPYLGLQTGIQTAHMEVQTTPVSVQGVRDRSKR